MPRESDAERAERERREREAAAERERQANRTSNDEDVRAIQDAADRQGQGG